MCVCVCVKCRKEVHKEIIGARQNARFGVQIHLKLVCSRFDGLYSRYCHIFLVVIPSPSREVQGLYLNPITIASSKIRVPFQLVLLRCR
jgi:hypothetical protein